MITFLISLPNAIRNLLAIVQFIKINHIHQMKNRFNTQNWLELLVIRKKHQAFNKYIFQITHITTFIEATYSALNFNQEIFHELKFSDTIFKSKRKMFQKCNNNFIVK